MHLGARVASGPWSSCTDLFAQVQIIFNGDLTVAKQGSGFWIHAPELECGRMLFL